MIKEDYVSFETSKLLKEKGFDEMTELAYELEYGQVRSDLPVSYWRNSEIGKHKFSCPTLQMAMKWLREVHNIYTEICLYKTSEDDIEPKKSRKAPYYTFKVWDTLTGDNVDKRLTNDFIGDTYEQACEAAIKYCLENLIWITMAYMIEPQENDSHEVIHTSSCEWCNRDSCEDCYDEDN